MTMIAKKEIPGEPWSRSFRTATALFAIILVLTQSGVYHGTATLEFYQNLTMWSLPAMFMVWGMKDMAGDKPGIGYAMSSRVIPALGTLFIWGMSYGLLEVALNKQSVSFGTLKDLMWNLVVGKGPEYLWVLYPLIGLYLVYPLIQRFTTDASKGEGFYMLLLCFVFAYLVPMIGDLMGKNTFVGVMDRLHIEMVMGWLGCYLAGWYVMHFPMSNLEEDLIYVLGLAGLILTFTGDLVFGGGHALWCSFEAPNVVLTALAVCTLFRYVVNDRAGRSSHSLGHFAMGIYFLHQLWFMVFTKYGLDFSFMPAALAIPLMAVILFVLSIPIALILNLIPKLGDIMT